MGLAPDIVLIDPTQSAADKRVLKNNQQTPSLNRAFQVSAHSNAKFIRDVVNGKKIEGKDGRIDSAERFDKRFSDNAEWQQAKDTKGYPVILYACNSGRSSDTQTSIAEKISEKYHNPTVYAPTRQMWMGSSGLGGIYGKTSEGAKNLDDPGYWLAYQKGKVVAAYDASWKPGSSTSGHKVNISTISKDHFEGDIGEKEKK